MKQNLEGYAARLANIVYNSNPYSWYFQNKEWSDWADGWIQADIDQEDE